MFTRQHYKAVAGIVKESTSVSSPIDPHSMFAKGVYSVKSMISRRLADYFQQDNPRFDRDKFMNACNKIVD